MPSPFPGMDPYLEDPALWRDFHTEFIVSLRRGLNEVLPDGYEASLEERTTLVELPPDEWRVVVPDVSIARDTSRSAAVVLAVSGGIAIEPVTVPMFVEEEVHEVWIEIYHHPERRLVTVIEVLSPTNKSASGSAEYQAKRRAVIRRGVSLVELDLLFGGKRVVSIALLPTGDYFAVVARSNRRPNCDVYGWSVRQELPRLPIPLEAPDPDVVVDLQAAFARAYEGGRYARRIKYDRPPLAALGEADRQWAADLAARKE